MANIGLLANYSEVILLVLWATVWKGLALWFAGKHRQKAWFVVLFLFNTLGILPIIYLEFFSKTAYVRKIDVKIPKVRRPKVRRSIKKKKKPRRKAKRTTKRKTKRKPKRKATRKSRRRRR